MIIYNLHSLLLLIFIVPLVYISIQINPDYFSFGHPVFLGILLFSSVASVLIGLKPKLYYIPTWIVFTALLVLVTFYKYDVTSGVYSVIFSAIILILGFYLKIQKTYKKQEKAKVALNDFIEDIRKVDPQEIVFYPDYLYPDLLIYEKYLDEMYVSLQKYWFRKKNVKSHYLELIDELNKRNNTESGINETAHLKSILEKDVNNGVAKYLLTNLVKNKGFE